MDALITLWMMSLLYGCCHNVLSEAACVPIWPSLCVDSMDAVVTLWMLSWLYGCCRIVSSEVAGVPVWPSLCVDSMDAVVLCCQKLQVYLFDQVFVMTRCCSHVDSTSYQVYRQPIALPDLTVRDHADGPTRKGSFRNAFSQLQTGELFMTVLWCVELLSYIYALLWNSYKIIYFINTIRSATTLWQFLLPTLVYFHF